MGLWSRLFCKGAFPSHTAQPFTVLGACGCTVGKVRDNNEDNFYFQGQHLALNNCGLPQVLSHKLLLDRPVVYAIFDGMGGEAFGEAGSYIAAKALARCVELANGQPTDLVQACLSANLDVCGFAAQHHIKVVGSTAAMLQFFQHSVEIANIGDSRIFLLRAGRLTQLSEDHTDLTAQISLDVPRKPRLTQHLGIPPTEMQLSPYYSSIELHVGDRFLLCSDGLTDMVPQAEIRHVLTLADTAEYAVKALIHSAMDYGGRDNTTIICCEIGC